MCFGGNNDPKPKPAPPPQKPLTWADAHSRVTGQSGPGGIGVTPVAEAAVPAENLADKAKREQKSRKRGRMANQVAEKHGRAKAPRRRPDGSRYADDRDPASRTNRFGGGKSSHDSEKKRAREQYLDDLRANPDGW